MKQNPLGQQIWKQWTSPFLAELFIIVTVMAEQSLLDPLQLPLLTTCSPN